MLSIPLLFMLEFVLEFVFVLVFVFVTVLAFNGQYVFPNPVGALSPNAIAFWASPRLLNVLVHSPHWLWKLYFPLLLVILYTLPLGAVYGVQALAQLLFVVLHQAEEPVGAHTHAQLGLEYIQSKEAPPTGVDTLDVVDDLDDVVHLLAAIVYMFRELNLILDCLKIYWVTIS